MYRVSRLTGIAFAAIALCTAMALSLSENVSAFTRPAATNQEPSQQDQDDKAAIYMQAKLSNSQLVLQGLVSEDFDAIADGARQMKKIAKAAHWPTTVDEVYQHYSFEFRRQCDKLVLQAEKKDLRAAHFTYLHMSTTCIDCHDYVRPRFRIEREPAGPVKLIPTEWDGPTKKLPRPAPDDDDKDA